MALTYNAAAPIWPVYSPFVVSQSHTCPICLEDEPVVPLCPNRSSEDGEMGHGVCGSCLPMFYLSGRDNCLVCRRAYGWFGSNSHLEAMRRPRHIEPPGNLERVFQDMLSDIDRLRGFEAEPEDDVLELDCVVWAATSELYRDLGLYTDAAWRGLHSNERNLGKGIVTGYVRGPGGKRLYKIFWVGIEMVDDYPRKDLKRESDDGRQRDYLSTMPVLNNAESEFRYSDSTALCPSRDQVARLGLSSNEHDAFYCSVVNHVPISGELACVVALSAESGDFIQYKLVKQRGVLTACVRGGFMFRSRRHRANQIPVPRISDFI